jgi:hypothetical protein
MVGIHVFLTTSGWDSRSLDMVLVNRRERHSTQAASNMVWSMALRWIACLTIHTLE